MREDRIRVSGSAVREVAADRAELTVRVREIDEDPHAAYERCAPRVQAVVAGLAEAVGAGGRAVARAVEVGRHWPEYEAESRLLRHEATCRVVVECPAERAGAMLAEALRLGADDAGRIRFTASARAAILDELLAEAVESARRKAERLAGAAGRSLRAVVAIKEPREEDDVVRASAVTEMSGGGDIDVEPSEIRLAKTVRVNFALG